MIHGQALVVPQIGVFFALQTLCGTLEANASLGGTGVHLTLHKIGIEVVPLGALLALVIINDIGDAVLIDIVSLHTIVVLQIKGLIALETVETGFGD